MHHSTTCNKVMGVIRILLGLVMLYFGVMKFFATPEMQIMTGQAATKLGLTFFSETIWFWIATVGEILAGLFLITGHWYKIGAVLSLIIMIFAINHMGPGWLPVAVAVLSIAVLIWGAGSWRMCHGSCCNGHGGCCGGDSKGCKDGKCGCDHDHKHHGHMHQQQ